MIEGSEGRATDRGNSSEPVDATRRLTGSDRSQAPVVEPPRCTESGGAPAG